MIHEADTPHGVPSGPTLREGWKLPLHPREPTPISWRRYDMAQVNELPEVISLMGRLIDAVDVGMPAGRGCAHPKPDLAKLILAQQYDGRCNRNSIGLLSLMGERLGIPSTRSPPSYKALERAYDDPAVIGILNEVFFLTQHPVSLHEERFAVDGTCFPTTIKENWESAKKRFTKKDGGKKRSVFEKTVMACGTTFKIIAAFAVAATPYANDSPYLKPILIQIGNLYRHVNLITADPAFLSRENCASIAELGAKARIMPKGVMMLRQLKGRRHHGRCVTKKISCEYAAVAQSALAFSCKDSNNSGLKSFNVGRKVLARGKSS